MILKSNFSIRNKPPFLCFICYFHSFQSRLSKKSFLFFFYWKNNLSSCYFDKIINTIWNSSYDIKTFSASFWRIDLFYRTIIYPVFSLQDIMFLSTFVICISKISFFYRIAWNCTGNLLKFVLKFQSFTKMTRHL